MAHNRLYIQWMQAMDDDGWRICPLFLGIPTAIMFHEDENAAIIHVEQMAPLTMRYAESGTLIDPYDVVTPDEIYDFQHGKWPKPMVLSSNGYPVEREVAGSAK